jgi:hypothetical protein
MSADDWSILWTANRHGINDSDIRHAIRNAVRVVEQDDGMTMYIGPARSGSVLEVGVVEKYGARTIVHAMPARRKYLRR